MDAANAMFDEGVLLRKETQAADSTGGWRLPLQPCRSFKRILP